MIRFEFKGGPIASAMSLYLLMLASGITSLCVLAVAFFLGFNLLPQAGEFAARVGSKQEVLQWHMEESMRLQKELQQKQANG